MGSLMVCIHETITRSLGVGIRRIVPRMRAMASLEELLFERFGAHFLVPGLLIER